MSLRYFNSDTFELIDMDRIKPETVFLVTLFQISQPGWIRVLAKDIYRPLQIVDEIFYAWRRA